MTFGPILAWVKHLDGGGVMAAFVAEAAPQRIPARRHCASKSEAERWIEDESRNFGASVKWVEPRGPDCHEPPRRGGEGGDKCPYGVATSPATRPRRYP
jgi:hypothetical protein